MTTKPKIDVLKKRGDFLRMRAGKVAKRPAFLLQARESDSQDIRVGYTCSKKVGNSPERNLAKRRLREIARAVLPTHGRAGWDYVFIGRAQVTGKRDFAKIRMEAERALEEIHK